MAEGENGLGPVLSRALRAISEAALAPWSVLRPGVRVAPVVAGPADEASQAPTREMTPAPEPRRPTPAPEPRRPARRPILVPEAVREEPARKRRRRPAPPRPEEGERNWRRPLEPAPQEAEPADPRPRLQVAPAAQALVRRARAWRAREGRAPSRVTPAAYDAVDVQARFGLIECSGPDLPLLPEGQTLLLAHTPPRWGPAALQGLRQGDTVDVLSTRSGAAGWAPLRVQFVTRAGYVPPGRPISTVALGVATAEWQHALRGQPEPPPRPREPPARGGRI
jgi:hypothetical protein